MGKRQRSDYRVDGGASSTESNDETLLSTKMNGGEVCTHIQKSIDLNTIRKQIKTNEAWFKKVCGKCLDEPAAHGGNHIHDSGKVFSDASTETTLWLCLKCGTQLCGRKQNQHALKHYTVPRSDIHALAMNTTTMDVWCYCCNMAIDPYAKPKLLELVELIKREVTKVRFSDTSTTCITEMQTKLRDTTDSVRNMVIDVLQSTTNSSYDVPDAAKFDSNNQTYEHKPDSGTGSNQPNLASTALVRHTMPIKNIVDTLPRVRGLCNLGNTCFFNAVLQCLARTPYLLHILKQSATEGEKVHIPGGMLKLPDGSETAVPPIDGVLTNWRSLTEALTELLSELIANAEESLSPNRLLQELTSKWPQFDGGDQHDSHELLRHLLESVRTDDLRRYQSLILQCLGLETRQQLQNVDSTQKAVAKFYNEQISQWVFRPEQVFRGSLVSTLTCQDCHHTSSQHEYFLDISLPVCVEKPQPPIRRRSSPEPDGHSSGTLTPLTGARGMSATNADGTAVSKSSTKKERESNKKAKRIAKHQKNRINLSSVGSGVGTLPSAGGDKVGNGGSDESEPMANMIPLTDDQPSPPDGSKVNDESSDESNEPSDADVEDNDVTDDPLSKNGSMSIVDQNGNQLRSLPEKSDDTPENLNKEADGNNIVCAVGISAQRAAHMARQLPAGNAESSETDEDTVKRRGDLQHGSGGGRDGGEEGCTSEPKRGRQRTFSHADWSNTIAPRYQCEDGEYSIQSCFNNFTAVELMTGNNKVCCEACTERINGKGGKSVNTNATKQFLISQPPAVLILHLKRFQVGLRSVFKKLNKLVSFPFVLDIAPFCGSKVKRASHIRPGQKRILYALYGLVEHSGSMHGGHYVAYVKVRPTFGPDDERWKFIPQGTKDELDRKSEQEMAKEQALRMGIHIRDSDDSLSSSHTTSDNDDSGQKLPREQDEQDVVEGDVGCTPKPTEPLPDIEPPPGKWYCVSDSYVREVTEESVLKVQAYLLFYERIF
ncbi:ubiquitin carboxyl-terminal hydrolase 45 [Anopheles funestus]|uniref:ubiquitin carboxyl-terminal hydrolase 45 n=1 Tax=Anopheles funestus TaxID=62324 RepID=UPI0020C73FA3|nr:ubiquitin carboxyl-terminal hydrolase 45 [Anopheles funestus]XP_049300084.1 ubiquitin carboxyl-terminal hydrolase 45 [Anopheles funestus]